MNPIHKYGIVLRLVRTEEAEFILKLRTETILNKFISPTSDDLTVQIKWILEYKTRESAGLEFYFVTEDMERNRYGTIRLYNFEENSFEIGSWLFFPKSPLGMAVEAHFIAIEEGFNHLNADFYRIEIRKLNRNILRYIKEFQITPG